MTDTTVAVDTSAVAKINDPAPRPVDGVDAELVGRLVEQARAAGLQLAGAGRAAAAAYEAGHRGRAGR